MSEEKFDDKSAIVQGEFHLSVKDSRALLDRDLEKWDTLLVEGRESVYNMKNSKFGFAYYSIGAITVRSIITYFHRMKEAVGLSSADPVDEAKIDTNTRIDAQHREIWGFTSPWLRWALLILALIGSGWVLKNPDFLKNINNTYFATWHSILLFYPTIPGLVHIFAVVNPTNSGKRNDEMVQNIVDYSAKNGHERILVLVGEMHRQSIAESLVNQGWSVESNSTHSHIGRGLTRLYKRFGDWE